MDLSKLDIDTGWTLFLDRDGVINRKLEDAYVRNWDEYEFLPGVLDWLKELAGIFGRIIVVTNQQGVGKGLMTEEQLSQVHKRMVARVSESGGRIDAVYYCPHLASDDCDCRKPRTGMVERAMHDHPDIDPARAVMVGDSIHDMEMGKRTGMYTVGVGPRLNGDSPHTDHHVDDLGELAATLKTNQ